MDNLQMLIVEYKKIMNFLFENKKYHELKDKNIIAVEKLVLDTLLKKYTYMELKPKLKTWRTLNFLLAEKNRFTTKRWIEKNGELNRLRVYTINKTTFFSLKNEFNF